MTHIPAQKNEFTNTVKQIGYTISPNALTTFFSPPVPTDSNKIAVVRFFLQYPLIIIDYFYTDSYDGIVALISVKDNNNVSNVIVSKFIHSYSRLHRCNGYEAQADKLQMKWNKLSQNQQSLSSLMRQLKQVQSIWKLQLKINLKINKLSKILGFNSHHTCTELIRTQTITNPILICLTSVRK